MTAVAGRTAEEAVTWAEDLLDRAERLPAWPDEGYDDIAGAANALRDSLDLTRALEGLGWNGSPFLAGCGEGVARDIERQAEALVTVIGKYISEGDAEHVRGEGGRQE